MSIAGTGGHLVLSVCQSKSGQNNTRINAKGRKAPSLSLRA